jgi:hypothetical protein
MTGEIFYFLFSVRLQIFSPRCCFLDINPICPKKRSAYLHFQHILIFLINIYTLISHIIP